jgi:hypothetical protein
MGSIFLFTKKHWGRDRTAVGWAALQPTTMQGGRYVTTALA